jgi:hypothetical protein
MKNSIKYRDPSVNCKSLFNEKIYGFTKVHPRDHSFGIKILNVWFQVCHQKIECIEQAMWHMWDLVSSFVERMVSPELLLIPNDFP